METFVLLMIFVWRAGGLMLVGMAFYKWGILQARKSKSFYTKGILTGLLIGLPIVVYGIVRNYEADWQMQYSMFLGSQYNYWGSLFVSFAWICLIMLIAKSEVIKSLQKRLAAVGQMALTNYLTQSIICSLIFYGHGFALFGQVERTGQVLVIIAVWVLQMIWSPIWLEKYRFGPFEWLWRSLTYMKPQPFRR